MNVFIAGAAGDLGRALIGAFTASGHRVTGLVRHEAAAEVVRARGGTPVRGDVFDPAALRRAADGAEVVIHALTAIPSGAAVRRASAWTENDRLRRAGTEALAAAAAAVGARRYLQQSVAWVVRRAPGDPPFDETTPVDPPALLRSAVDGEAIARAAGARHGFSVGVLRGGAFYGADTGASRGIAALLRRRQMPVIGRGDFLVAPIHVDDMASAFVAAAVSDREGTWHVVDDAPLPFASLLRAYADALGAPAPRAVPRWLARILLGPLVMESLTTSMHTSNARIRRELGWAPAIPSVAVGIPAMVRAWAATPA